MTLTQLVALGFDASSSDGTGHASVSCSRCAAVVINDTPCHEHGCPNLMHECNGCDAIIPARQRYCEECA